MEMVGLFASTAMLLAGLGIYGTISFLIHEQSCEIAIRLALGAQRSDILRMVLRQGLTLAAAGAGVGLVGACSFPPHGWPPLRCLAIRSLHFRRQLRPCAARHASRPNHDTPRRMTFGPARYLSLQVVAMLMTALGMLVNSPGSEFQRISPEKRVRIHSLLVENFTRGRIVAFPDK